MLTVNYTDVEGTEHTVEAETIPEIVEQLESSGYAGGTLTVFNASGWVCGWASAETYRYA